MTVVVDANVAIKWFIEQPGSDNARKVQAYRGPLSRWSSTSSWNHHGNAVIAASASPGPISPRIACRQSPLVVSETRTLGAMARLPALARVGPLDYATYDCFYLALSRERSAPLVTADKRFINRLGSTPYATNVIHLSDWT
jgi:predicted nucleic acid-binding protein